MRTFTSKERDCAQVLWDYLLQRNIEAADGHALQAILEDSFPKSLMEKLRSSLRTHLPRVHFTLMFQKFWDQIPFKISTPLPVPFMPLLTSWQLTSLERFSFLPLHTPRITEAEYPESFVTPTWARDIDASRVESKPLTGEWIAIETIEKPDCEECKPDFYGKSSLQLYPADALFMAMRISSRFEKSWEGIHDERFFKWVEKQIGFPQFKLRLPSIEEWVFAANVFNWIEGTNLRRTLPNLLSTNSKEWCENRYDEEGAVVTGLDAVNGPWLAGQFNRFTKGTNLGFRIVAEL